MLLEAPLQRRVGQLAGADAHEAALVIRQLAAVGGQGHLHGPDLLRQLRVCRELAEVHRDELVHVPLVDCNARSWAVQVVRPEEGAASPVDELRPHLQQRWPSARDGRLEAVRVEGLHPGAVSDAERVGVARAGGADDVVRLDRVDPCLDLAR